MSRILAAIASLLLIAISLNAQQPSPPTGAREQAKIVVYMPHHSATTWRFSGKFYVDEKRVVEISKNRYFVLHLDPGSHEFYVREKKLGGLDLILQAGETYYLKINLDEGGARIKFRGVSVVPSSEGEFAIKQMQPIKKADIYDKMLVDPQVVSQ